MKLFLDYLSLSLGFCGLMGFIIIAKSRHKKDKSDANVLLISFVMFVLGALAFYVRVRIL